LVRMYPEHVVLVLPVHNPDQPAKTEPVLGTALSVTYAPYVYGPAGVAVTVPEPVPAYLIVTVYFVAVDVDDDVAELCDIVNVFPATLNDAVRAAPVFAATLYDRLLLPLPLDPDVMVAHDTPVDALQEQPLVVPTAILPVPPLEVNDALEGETLYVHDELVPPVLTSFE